MLKTPTKILQVYHQLAAITMLSWTDIQVFHQSSGCHSWGQKEDDPLTILGKLYEYYYNFIPVLCTAFKQFFTNPEQIKRDFEKVLKFFCDRISRDIYHSEKVHDRIKMWISFLTLEIVIPTCHQSFPNPKLKLKNRRLPELSKSIVIDGDSNLSQIEPFAQPSCQVESFPGAWIEHIAHLFSSYHHQKVPNNLILSIGINDATRSSELHTDIGTIVSTLPFNFKSTKIFFVQLQVSRSQPVQVHQKAVTTQWDGSCWNENHSKNFYLRNPHIYQYGTAAEAE